MSGITDASIKAWVLERTQNDLSRLHQRLNVEKDPRLIRVLNDEIAVLTKRELECGI